MAAQPKGAVDEAVDDMTDDETRRNARKRKQMATILWIIAAILVISGIFAIFRKQLLWGIVLIVVGLLVGPGGVTIFHP